MTVSPLPEYVDARKIFKHKGSFRGDIALSKLARLQSCVVSNEAKISAELDFWIDDFGRNRISGHTRATLPVQCQRCLEPITIEVEDDINLVLVKDEEAAKALEPEFDPWIIEDPKIIPADIIDEQLLLAMPIVSFHQSGTCSETSSFSSGTMTNEVTASNKPFAVLASLKKSDT